MNYKIPLSFPLFDGNETLYSQLAINSGHLATYGPFIEKFEKKLSKRIQTHEAIALNSGTSALHLGLVLLGIGIGDEVICQSFTFCASANPVVYLGAQPIFVDSEKDTWNMCPDLLEDTILCRIAKGKKPKAIIMVHLFGMPAKMKELMEISSKYQIPVLEDAAEAVGSTYGGKYCGTFGQLGVFSFNGNKIITTGGGGALLSNNAHLIQRARHLASQAREDFSHYEHLEIGYNYKMNNLSASIGLAQLEQLDSWVESRQTVNEKYRELLKDVEGIDFQTEEIGSKSNFWLTTILIDSEKVGFTNKTLRTSLLKKSIETRFLWKPLHLQPVFKSMPFYGGTICESFFENGLCLPSSANLTVEDQEIVVDVILKELTKTVS